MISESDSPPFPFRPFGTTFSKNTYHYRQVIRDGEWAIFGQYIKKTSEIPCAYEVIRIRVVPAGTIMGNAVPAREVGPSNESFGKDGFTYPTLGKAKAKLHEMVEKRDAK
mgnify:FL=1